MSIQYDPNAASIIEQGFSTDGVQLPFPVPFIFWSNGSKKNVALKQHDPVEYFGGWVAEATSMDEVCETEGRIVPKPFYESAFSPKSGDAFPAYKARNLLVAPIASRFGWRTNDAGKQSTKLQMLCYAAESLEGVIVPWGVVALTVSGMQTRELRNAVSAWQNKLRPVIKQFAPGCPAMFFYLSLGSFGDQRIEVTVGKGANTSPIVPIKPFMPQQITEKTLETLFVGNELTTVMGEYRQLADEWLKAWDEKSDENRGNGNGNGYGYVDQGPENFNDGMMDQPF